MTESTMRRTCGRDRPVHRSPRGSARRPPGGRMAWPTGIVLGRQRAPGRARRPTVRRSQQHPRSRSAGPPGDCSGRAARRGSTSSSRTPARTPSPCRHVRVTITSINAPKADGAHPCTLADFRVRPMRVGTFVLPRDGFTSLAGLGVPARQWPRLKMRNRPVNQDGCKGASLTLGYRGYRSSAATRCGDRESRVGRAAGERSRSS